MRSDDSEPKALAVDTSVPKEPAKGEPKSAKPEIKKAAS